MTELSTLGQKSPGRNTENENLEDIKKKILGFSDEHERTLNNNLKVGNTKSGSVKTLLTWLKIVENNRVQACTFVPAHEVQVGFQSHHLK